MTNIIAQLEALDNKDWQQLFSAMEEDSRIQVASMEIDLQYRYIGEIDCPTEMYHDFATVKDLFIRENILHIVLGVEESLEVKILEDEINKLQKNLDEFNLRMKLTQATDNVLLKSLGEIDKELQDFHISAYKYDKLYEIRNRIKHELETRKNNKENEEVEK